MSKRKLGRRITAGIAAGLLAVGGVLATPQAASAYPIATHYSADGGVQTTGSINFNNKWSYTANWIVQDIKNDGRSPHVTVKVYGNPLGNSSYNSSVLKSQTFSPPYAFGNYTTSYNKYPATIYTVEVAVCNYKPNYWCKYRLYDNPYT